MWFWSGEKFLNYLMYYGRAEARLNSESLIATPIARWLAPFRRCGR